LELDEHNSLDSDSTKNLFIEGDNLDVLKLLRSSHTRKIRMIYIDPPYNRGRSFVYKDDYSEWLSMMYSRLVLAHDLLAEDGVLFASIDDGQVHNLRLLLNEIFGEQNFVATIIWEKKFSPQNDARWLSDNHDYILLYARNKSVWRPRLLPRTKVADARYSNRDSDPRGPWTSSDLTVKTYNSDYDYEITTPSGRGVSPPRGRCWGMPKAAFLKLVEDDRIWFGKDGGNVPRLKRFLSDVKQGMTARTIWTRDEVGDNQEARRTLRNLFGDIGVFDTPKPIRLVKRMLQLSTSTSSGDVVLDFFAGSCSTAHAVMELNSEDRGNRRYIMVQLPEPVPEDTRAHAMGFRTVSEIGLERIKRASTVIEESCVRDSDGTEPPVDIGVKYLRVIPD
jgi:adenine-specific DNA-methyltransferase